MAKTMKKFKLNKKSKKNTQNIEKIDKIDATDAIGYGEISPERQKLREKARKERKRKSAFQIFKNKLISPFQTLHRKLATYRFIMSRDSRKVSRAVGKKEQKVSERAANFVADIDRNNEIRVNKVKKAFHENKQMLETQSILEVGKRKPIAGYIIIMLIVSTGIISTFNMVTAYEYSYKGRVMGVVAEQQDVTEIIGVVNSQLSKEHGLNVQLDSDKDIQFRRVVSIGETPQDSEEVLNSLTYMQDITVSGFGIFVDGKRAGVVNNEEDAEEILSNILAEYSKPTAGVTYESINFKEEVKVEETNVKLGTVADSETVEENIMSGLEVKKGHIVEEGDTLASVAEEYDLTEAELQEQNPDAKKEGLVLGETLTVMEKQPLVNVEVVAEVDYTKVIPFEVVEKEDDSIYEEMEEIAQEGEDGEEKIKSKITYVNGVMVSENIIDQKVTKEAVDETILIGTKEKPPTVGGGEYINPFPGGSLSSPFGMRSSGFHEGIDIAGSTGSPLYAADGGTVTYSGYNGAYGNVIVIDHQNGQETLYAHNSALHVQVGDKVYQGQQIGLIGSTGRSTGPHVHFEIHIDGEIVDPGAVLGLY